MTTLNEDVEEYLKTRFEESLKVKIPDAHEGDIPLATKLLAKQKEMMQLEDTVVQAREEYSTKMRKLTKRRNEFQKKEELLKESLRNFEKFLTENERKRIRATDKANEERRVQYSKDKEIQRLQGETEELQEKKLRLKCEIEKYQISRTFLDMVVETSDQFDEVGDVIARFEILTAANEELLEEDLKLQKAIDGERDKLLKFTNDKKNEILTYSNQLAELQTRFDYAQGEAVKWESRWSQMKNQTTVKTLQLGQIKMTISNMFQLVGKYQKIEGQIDDIGLQLQKIEQFITDWAEVVDAIKKQEEARSTQAVPSVNTSML